MYYVEMPSNEGGIQLDLIMALMTRRGMDGKKLSELSGVSEATISKLLNGKINGTSAANLGRIAVALGVSVDYLLGLTDEPMPKSLTKEALIIELVQLAQELTDRRRRDLILAARAYLETGAQLRGNRRQLAGDLADLIAEAGGRASREKLLNYLQSDIWGDDLRRSLPPDEGDGPVDDKE